LATDRVERRLTAILAADVAGYSRLMGADEEGTLAQLKAHRRALVDPKIKEHRGRIVKTTGDGMLVEFASVVDALRCAVEVQRGMVERNADVPEDKRIEFRVGIHQGDIVVEDRDIFGDGVPEPSSPPGVQGNSRAPSNAAYHSALPVDLFCAGPKLAAMERRCPGWVHGVASRARRRGSSNE
jgi:hypothetical protein